MKTYLDSEKSEVRIEILPLIDVVFCILVFFILGAVRLTAPEGIGVDLPTAKTSEPQLSETLTVQLEANGALSIDGVPVVARTKLEQDLKTYLTAKPAGLIVLKADKQSRYELVVQVVDLLRSIGGNRVALETIQPASSSAAPGGLPTPSTPGGALPARPTTPQQPNSAQPVPQPAQPASPQSPRPTPSLGTSPTLPGQPLSPNSNPGTFDRNGEFNDDE